MASAILRGPWLLNQTRIVIDRFHSKGDICTNYFDADSHIGLTNNKTSSAESFNARIGKSTHHIRFLKGTNLILFLRIRFALLNLCAHFKSTFHRTDIEDEDLAAFLRTIYDCKCYLCRQKSPQQEIDNMDIDFVPLPHTSQ